MNILLIGAGGREHALAWKIAQSPLVANLYACPGNPGIAEHALLQDIDLADHQNVIDFCDELLIDLVVFGPEQPLVDGLADSLRAAGIDCFGPSQKAAQLEGSKGFTKDLCKRHNIPTAAYEKFTDAAAAKNYVTEHVKNTSGAPIVIKADGLAAGKGVVVAQTIAEAHAAIDDMIGGKFGRAGASVVVEEFMEGEEASFFVLTDGTHILPLTTAQDHKRVGDGDTGPNTGGMGAYSPAAIMTAEITARVIDEIIWPTVRGMAAENMPYMGVLYAGLMLTKNGPELIEYNCRFGDPECQVLMMRLKSDIVPLLRACATGALADAAADWSDDVALTVVYAGKGYPDAPLKATEIRNIAAAESLPDVKVFHAGTKLDGDRLLANGGRVLNVTATGPTVSAAQAKAYAAVRTIDWPGGFYRSDIGAREIAREKK
jgi:phosphoribosylamine--glycine ligase